ncbi:hypothetical protein [Nocardia sp. NPDC019255]
MKRIFSDSKNQYLPPDRTLSPREVMPDVNIADRYRRFRGGATAYLAH